MWFRNRIMSTRRSLDAVEIVSTEPDLEQHTLNMTGRITDSLGACLKLIERVCYRISSESIRSFSL
jgi:hypothetical protein